MRFYLGVLATMLGLVMFDTSNAHADVPRTFDANGVLVGSWIAPVQLEIFCEPQCPHCAEFEAADGDRLAAALAGGRLAITYRWLTFLDGRHHNDVSARLVNALFLAADPATSPTAYQAFVQDLYRHQSSDGPSRRCRRGDGPRKWTARCGGRPDRGRRVRGGRQPRSTTRTRHASKRRTRTNPGTPTIYNLNTRSVVDTQDPGWLDALTS